MNIGLQCSLHKDQRKRGCIPIDAILSSVALWRAILVEVKGSGSLETPESLKKKKGKLNSKEAPIRI